MNFLKRYKKEILLFIGISILYLVFRLVNITHHPIFTDEAIYLWWAQVALHEPTLRFISLVDGKQPLFVWFTIASMKFIHDPLLAGRSVSLIAGLFTMFGLWLLSLELFKEKKVAWITSLLYIAYPFSHIYDRMALMDGMVGTFAIWGIYFSVLLVRKLNLSISYTLGFILGGSMLTKSSGALVAYMLPFTLILFNFRVKNRIKKLFLWGALAAFAFLIAEGLYSVLRLSAFYYIIGLKNATFVYPFSEWIKHPFVYFLNNLRILLEWFLPYVNFYNILILSSFLYVGKFVKERILLLLYFFLPLTALALFGIALFPRFEYSMTLSLLPLAALGLVLIEKKIALILKSKVNPLYITAGLLAIFLAYPIFVDYNFSFNPKKAQIAKADYDQYIGGWTAGGGMRESMEFFNKEAAKGPIFIATQGTFGLMPYGYEIYYRGDKNIATRGFYPVDEVPKEVLDSAKTKPTYFVFYQPCPACKAPGYAPVEWNYPEVFSFKKNEGIYLKIYKID